MEKYIRIVNEENKPVNPQESLEISRILSAFLLAQKRNKNPLRLCFIKNELFCLYEKGEVEKTSFTMTYVDFIALVKRAMRYKVILYDENKEKIGETQLFPAALLEMPLFTYCEIAFFKPIEYIFVHMNEQNMFLTAEQIVDETSFD